ncbi:MAG: hypothetical protein HOC91_14785 [Nitrospinaceae bacterium]|nr:hypothetical protein [Nitrospinaceae bacterium]MBT4431773.1 hypothetical protein [Nitrospinaceae bacterium]MBT5368304.1 hypothetical protein [Nitrospinaceae bacterium]MBT5947670.1 hypothetical protein [Nitrospinaceae bacterium]MBT6393241.1 hypothetical protein [Nitrospinaceae bacterium]
MDWRRRRSPENVIQFRNQRGTAEQRAKMRPQTGEAYPPSAKNRENTSKSDYRLGLEGPSEPETVA